MMILKFINNLLNPLNLNLKRLKINKELIHIDYLLKDKIISNSIVFDVGGNKGQSIEKYLKIFDNPTIHSFEPVKSEFDIMQRKFKDNKNIILNNFAIGDKNEKKNINVTTKTGGSSFNKINPGTRWIKIRSKIHGVNEENYVKRIEEVQIVTLDFYCKKHNINTIDLLKIDTQGYEDKVLIGSSELMKQNKIKAITTEIMHDNNYGKSFSFSDIEKYLLPNNFRMVLIQNTHNNLFYGILFSSDVVYFNKTYFKL